MDSSFSKAANRRKEKAERVSERDVEDAFSTYCKGKGCWPIRLIFLSGRGWPDRTVFCKGGRIFFIEFKNPKVKPVPSGTQALVMRRLMLLGFEYKVFNKIGQAETFLDGYL